MAKKMLIDATHAEETRVVVVDGNKVDEFDFETQSRRQLAGNIYLAKVMRVEPSLQAAFVDYGGNRHGFLAFAEIHPDYYQIPVADREALMAEEEAYAESLKADEEEAEKPKRRRSRSRSRAAKANTDDAVATKEVSTEVAGMETIDLDADAAPEDVVLDADATDAPQPDVIEAEAAEPAPVETEAAEAPAEAEAAVEPEAEQAPAEAAEAEVAEAADQPEADTEASEQSEERADAAEALTEAPDDDEPKSASDKDASVEDMSKDDAEDIRPRRKPRPKRYKIQEVVKVRQIMLVQVVKEERGNKGAALTTYLSLAGRYCVLMPNTARGGGISRKITNAADRKKLKEIAQEIDVPKGAGLIVRTAGSQRTKAEIKRDYEYLQRLWEQIRELTLASTAPAKIYEEGDLIKRSIRDLYGKDIDEVIVEGERGYRTAKDFMKMIMPSHAKNVKHYRDQMPLYARYQVENHLTAMFNPTVQLPSGGYLVIGVTEALVAVDVNSGRATKEGSIEQTALKTNLEAAEEVARQMRLRDLAGLIVIDFIDMDERRNNTAVEKRLKDKLKNDRARIQVGKISGFGLLEMSRQRLRPGMLEATTQPCPHCHGTGLLRSDDNVALAILRALEEEGVRGRSREVLVKAPVQIINYLINDKREHIAKIEGRYGMAIRLEADMHMISPDYQIEKFKTATRTVKAVEAPVVSADSSLMADIDDAEVIEAEVEAETPTDEEGAPKRKRRRRRRRKPRGEGAEQNAEQSAEQSEGEEAEGEAKSDEDAPEATEEDAPKPKRTRSRSRKKPAAEEGAEAADETPKAETADGEEAEKPKRTRTRSRKKAADAEATDTPAEAAPEAEAAEEAPKPKRTRTRKKPAAKASEDAPAEDNAEAAEDAPAEEAPKPKRTRKRAPKKDAEAAPAVEATPEPEAPAEPAPEVSEAPAAETAPEPAAESDAAVEEKAEDKPKRRGWWSLSR